MTSKHGCPRRRPIGRRTLPRIFMIFKRGASTFVTKTRAANLVSRTHSTTRLLRPRGYWCRLWSTINRRTASSEYRKRFKNMRGKKLSLLFVERTMTECQISNFGKLTFSDAIPVKTRNQNQLWIPAGVRPRLDWGRERQKTVVFRCQVFAH